MAEEEDSAEAVEDMVTVVVTEVAVEDTVGEDMEEATMIVVVDEAAVDMETVGEDMEEATMTVVEEDTVAEEVAVEATTMIVAEEDTAVVEADMEEAEVVSPIDTREDDLTWDGGGWLEEGTL